MFLENIPIVLGQIKPDDVVLDIGGWAQTFRRANYVMDAFPYQTRGWYSNIGMSSFTGDTPEQFTEETWVQRDICAREPFPFEDKFFDYVICSHVLEDIRDPLWVCSEIMRVGKRGYIEVPSRLSESIVSSETKTVGASHHRWLVTIEQSKITFEMKYHLIHKPGLHLPSYTYDLLRPEQTVQWLFWENSFEFAEASIPLGDEEVAQRLQTFVQQNKPAASPFFPLVWNIKQRSRPMRHRLKINLRELKTKPG